MPQMPSIPYASPRMYDNSQGTDRLIDLMLRRGDVEARGQAASGAIWGRAVEDVGQIAAGAVQQYGEQKEGKKQAAALDAFVASDLWVKDPRAGVAESVRILGPVRGVQFFEGLQGSLKMQTAQTPAEARAALPSIARAYLAAPEASRPKLWAGVGQLLQSTGLLAQGQSLGEYNPEEHDPIIASLAAEGVTKKQTPEEIRSEAQARAEGTRAGAPPTPPAFQHVETSAGIQPFDPTKGTLGPVLAQGKQPASSGENAGTWTEVVGPDGAPILFNAKTNQTRPYPEGVKPKPGGRQALASEERKQFASVNFVYPKLDAFTEFVRANPGFYGQFDAKKTQLKQMFPGFVDSDFASNRAFIGRLNSEIRKAMFGSALTATEKGTADSFLIGDKDQPEVMLAKVAAIKDRMRSDVDYYRGLGYNVGAVDTGAGAKDASPSDVNALLKKHGF